MKVKNNLKGYKVEFFRQAAKEFKKLEKIDREKITSKLDDLVDGKENLDIKKLEGQSTHLYRLRVDEYRIIYRVQHKEIIVMVVQIGHRKEVYRRI